MRVNICNCYATGVVSAGQGSSKLGGLCGANSSGTISHCYFLITSGPNNGLGTPLTSTQMKQENSYIGWDFVNETANGISSWWILHSGTFPTLFYFDTSFVPYEFAGQGTEENPYLITTPEDFGAIWQQPDRCYQLQNDIDLADINWSIAAIPEFDGIFNGNNKIISNLKISGGSYLGLFGILKNHALVTNLGLENANITGGNYTKRNGMLCGYNNYGNIANCYAKMSLTGGDEPDCLGGLCGFNNYGGIANCYTQGLVTSGIKSQNIGGLCGYNHYGEISNSYTVGQVTCGNDSRYIGGLCGNNWYSNISISYSNSTIISGSGSQELGGLSGHNLGNISECFSTGSVAGMDRSQAIGGLCGRNRGTINDCYSFSVVSGKDRSSYLGGLCGYNDDGDIGNSYSTGIVTGQNGSSNISGLCGYQYGNNAEIRNSFWDIMTSGQTTGYNLDFTYPGIINNVLGKTTAEMMALTTFTSAGWDFTDSDGDPMKWLMLQEGKYYPRLWWDPTYGGTGDPNDPYLIYTAEQMQLIGFYKEDWGKHFKLMADIDLGGYTGTEFNMIGAGLTAFTGVFDGNGHSISHFNYSVANGQYIGLFSFINSPNALIKDLELIDPNVSCLSGIGVAALVGDLFNGQVIGCTVRGGQIRGQHWTGGLVGGSWYGEIRDCYANTQVIGEWSTGGIIGSLNGDAVIYNCVSDADVRGGSEAGGIAGDDSGIISKCRSGGNIQVTSRTAGGIAGVNTTSGVIQECMSKSTCQGPQEIGGVVGRNLGYVGNCYSMSVVIGKSSLGGVAGLNWDGTVEKSYSASQISGNSVPGGVIGYLISGNCLDSFWDKNIVSYNNGIGVGLTTTEMMTISLFTDAGWDFVGEDVNGVEDIWYIYGMNYPRLTWQKLSGDLTCPDGVGIEDLMVLAEEWLEEGDFFADIAPGPDGDGIVNLLDFAVLAEHWLAMP